MQGMGILTSIWLRRVVGEKIVFPSSSAGMTGLVADTKCVLFDVAHMLLGDVLDY